ncbi:MAG: AAA family ATPase [Actinobacteria bacterium]|nr:AAA family ATPase [Actinomycetota bacterium]
MSGSAFTEFCAAGLWPGVGPLLAGQLLDAGITGPADVTVEKLRNLPKVGASRAERLLSGWIGALPVYDIAELVVPVGLPARTAGRAVEVLGAGAAGVLRDDPWRLLELPDVRVVEADRLAVAVLPGVGRDDPRRGRALVARALVRAARDGHTAWPVDQVHAALVADGIADPGTAVAAAEETGAVLAVEDGLLTLDRYAMAEAGIAEAVSRLVATARPLAPSTTGRRTRRGAGEPGDTELGDAELDDVRLDDVQRSAVTAVLRHGVSVLTGGPGTGKSRTVATVVRLAERHGKAVALAAPTGRAAKRLEELTDSPASTIHRLLGAQGMTGGFRHGEADPLEADVVVIDEVSMLDAELAAALLEACADGTHVLLVGDPAQLPSIGPGRVLADLVESGVVPVTELTTLYRQAEGGAIARLATGVRSGTLPAVDSADREVVVVPAGSSAQAAHRVAQLVTDSIPRALGVPADHVQVVTPVHRGPAGTIELNRALKARLNPGSGTVSGFDPGDRVVAVANHLDAEPVGFANGEIGVVSRAADRTVTVEFASGPAEVTGKALADLRHGWAVTVHRAQGSEWPAVVAVLPAEAGGMLSRPLVYTALTRAQRHLSIVHAAGPALARAVREIGARPRRSRLRTLLAEEFAAAGDRPEV